MIMIYVEFDVACLYIYVYVYIYKYIYIYIIFLSLSSKYLPSILFKCVIRHLTILFSQLSIIKCIVKN